LTTAGSSADHIAPRFFGQVVGFQEPVMRARNRILVVFLLLLPFCLLLTVRIRRPVSNTSNGSVRSQRNSASPPINTSTIEGDLLKDLRRYKWRERAAREVVAVPMIG